MQIYTENRFCLPLFYLIVLGVALSIWICPDKAFATGIADYVCCVYTKDHLNINAADLGLAVAPACILDPKSLNLRQNMAYVEEVAE